LKISPDSREASVGNAPGKCSSIKASALDMVG
jgi:hypothetical protein